MYRHPSTFDKKITIKSLTVLEVKNMAILDLKREDPIKFINSLVQNSCNLTGLKNDYIGRIIQDILDVSNLDYNDETKKNLLRITQIASTHPTIFNDNFHKKDVKTEMDKLYLDVLLDIQLDLNAMLKDTFKILTNMHISMSDLDRMEYWEYKKYLEFI